jgi:hypothetical protein
VQEHGPVLWTGLLPLDWIDEARVTVHADVELLMRLGSRSGWLLYLLQLAEVHDLDRLPAGEDHTLHVVIALLFVPVHHDRIGTGDRNLKVYASPEGESSHGNARLDAPGSFTIAAPWY